jgi:hypothetical protein
VVVGYAAIAHPPLRHDGVETRVGDRGRLARKRVDGVAMVLLLNLAVPLATEVKQDATNDRSHREHADNSATGNGARVGALLLLGWRRDQDGGLHGGRGGLRFFRVGATPRTGWCGFVDG